MINVFNLNKHAIATDGVSKSAYSFVGDSNQFTSGLDYLITDETEQGVFDKVFVNPEQVTDPETGDSSWDISALTLKSLAEIQAIAENT